LSGTARTRRRRWRRRRPQGRRRGEGCADRLPTRTRHPGGGKSMPRGVKGGHSMQPQATAVIVVELRHGVVGKRAPGRRALHGQPRAVAGRRRAPGRGTSGHGRADAAPTGRLRSHALRPRRSTPAPVRRSDAFGAMSDLPGLLGPGTSVEATDWRRNPTRHSGARVHTGVQDERPCPRKSRRRRTQGKCVDPVNGCTRLVRQY
jgi:hypothetical protein